MRCCINLSTLPSGLSTFLLIEHRGGLVAILFKVLHRNIAMTPSRIDQKAFLSGKIVETVVFAFAARFLILPLFRKLETGPENMIATCAVVVLPYPVKKRQAVKRYAFHVIDGTRCVESKCIIALISADATASPAW